MQEMDKDWKLCKESLQWIGSLRIVIQKAVNSSEDESRVQDNCWRQVLLELVINLPLYRVSYSD